MQRHISIGEEQHQQQARSVDVEKGFDEKDVNISQDSGFTTPALGRHFVVREQELRPVTQSTIPSPNRRLKILQWALQKSNAGIEIDTSPPPDGGLKAWMAVILAHLVGFNTFGFLNAYGVLQTYYTSLLQLPPSDISWIGSIQAFLMLFVSAFSGRLSDAGYFHQIVCVGSIIQVLGIFTASASTTYWQLLLSHGVCVGLGGGIVLIPCLSLVGTYFVKRRPLALAICAIGNSAGGLVFAAILQHMIPRVGFTWAMRTVGFVMIAILVPANVILKPRAIERKPAALFEWSAFKEPVYVFFAIGMFLSFLGQWIPVFYLGSFGRSILHIPTTRSASLILIINGVGIAGRVIPALLASHFGPLNLMVPLSAFAALVLFAWPGVVDYEGILVFDIFYGFIMAAAQGMFPPALGSLTTDVSKMGTRMGMVFSICGFSLLIGQPLAGVLIAADGGRYLICQMYAGASLVAGAAFLGAARVMRVGWKIKVKV